MAGEHHSSPSSSSHQKVRDQLARYLEHHDLKQTKPRRWIIEYLLSMGEGMHVSAEHIHLASKRQGCPLGLATVYRSLNLLVDAGIVEQHNFQNNNAVFEVRYPDTHHDHLVCWDCGVIKEFEEDEIERLQEQVAQRLGFQLISHRLELLGRCLSQDCEQKKAAGGISEPS